MQYRFTQRSGKNIPYVVHCVSGDHRVVLPLKYITHRRQRNGASRSASSSLKAHFRRIKRQSRLPQIQNMILQGYDAIVVNAASPTALNGAVKAACDAGITVVSFDGIVTEPCAWRIAVDFKQMGRDQIKYLSSRYPEGGNLLEIRGLAGVFVDDEIHAGIEEEVKSSKFKIVGSVNGDWAQDVAQKAVAGVLPSLPELTAVVTQGGDGYGAAQAIAATDRKMPTIIMGNRQDELKWWSEQKAKSGYETMSASIAPGIGTLAFWVAQQILDGKEVPKDLSVPFLKISQDTLEESLKTTPEGSVANVEYSLTDAQAVIDAVAKK